MENLWDHKKTAEYLGIAPATIYNWVHQRKIPFLKINNDIIRFDPVEIREWTRSNRRTSGKSQI